jgi:hypothetical protein
MSKVIGYDVTENDGVHCVCADCASGDGEPIYEGDYLGADLIRCCECGTVIKSEDFQSHH